ncbi:MAG: hypothetical protein ABJZ55_05270 [Fuerstiella sp.]
MHFDQPRLARTTAPNDDTILSPVPNIAATNIFTDVKTDCRADTDQPERVLVSACMIAKLGSF